MVLPGLAVSEGASRVVIADGAAPLTACVLGAEYDGPCSTQGM